MRTQIKIEKCDKPFCVIHTENETEEIANFAEKIRMMDINGRTTAISGWNGDFYLVSPYLVRNAGSTLSAVIIQYFCTGIIGANFSTSSIFFEIDKWSLLKQSVLHFVLTSVLMYIVGFVCGWFPHNIQSTLVWFGVFLVIYIIFWISFFLFYKKKTCEINKSLEK